MRLDTLITSFDNYINFLNKQHQDVIFNIWCMLDGSINEHSVHVDYRDKQCIFIDVYFKQQSDYKFNSLAQFEQKLNDLLIKHSII